MLQTFSKFKPTFCYMLQMLLRKAHLLLHVADAAQKGPPSATCCRCCSERLQQSVHTHSGYRRCATAMFNEINPDELGLALGTKSYFRYIPIHKVVNGMDPRTCTVLPVFHAFTGCDTVSSFGGRGKKTAWNTWQVFPVATPAFERLLLVEDCISGSVMSVLERFVVLLCDRTSDMLTVNDARKRLLTQKSRSLENIPPTLKTVRQHIKCASYQATKQTAGARP